MQRRINNGALLENRRRTGIMCWILRSFNRDLVGRYRKRTINDKNQQTLWRVSVKYIYPRFLSIFSFSCFVPLCCLDKNTPLFRILKKSKKMKKIIRNLLKLSWSLFLLEILWFFCLHHSGILAFTLLNFLLCLLCSSSMHFTNDSTNQIQIFIRLLYISDRVLRYSEWGVIKGLWISMY